MPAMDSGLVLRFQTWLEFAIAIGLFEQVAGQHGDAIEDSFGGRIEGGKVNAYGMGIELHYG